jgi:hypothetical protein
VQVGGNRRQGGVQDGGVQHLHEDGDGHQKRQPARGRVGGVHRKAGRKRAVIIAIPFVFHTASPGFPPHLRHEIHHAACNAVFSSVFARPLWAAASAPAAFSVVFYEASNAPVFFFCGFGKCSKIAPVCEIVIFL